MKSLSPGHGSLSRFVFLLLPLLFVLTASSQQALVSRLDVYTGFTDLYSTALGLNQPGFHIQAGVQMRPWYSIGADYSVADGDEILKPSLLGTKLQQEVAGAEEQYQAAGLLPANYQLAIPTHAFTQTFAAGPQIVYRRFSKATLFVRPSLGALRERATPHPGDAFAALIAGQLAPAGYKLDWTGFYGAGGGGEFAISRRFGLRAQLDVVYNHPFNDILANGRWTARYSVGPSFHFGRNVAAAGMKSAILRTSPVRSVVSSSSRP